MLEQFTADNLIPISWVLFAIIILAFVIFIIRTGNYALLTKIVNNAVNAAEKKWGAGTGAIKYVEASAYINNMLPWYLKIVFTPSLIDKLIETVVKGLQTVTAATVPIMTIAVMPATVVTKKGDTNE